MSPQYAPGTRVANPLEGRTGFIQSYIPATLSYILLFHDGHKDTVHEQDIHQFVIHTINDPAPRIDPLLHCEIIKHYQSYDSTPKTYKGSITGYNALSATYRITYENGYYEDLTTEETMRFVTSTAHTDVHETRHVTVPVIVRFDKRVTAYFVIRKVILAILAQNIKLGAGIDRQTAILTNIDIQAKAALEKFLEAGGLCTLQKVLALWIRSTSTHSGALLLLKVLAMLPGIHHLLIAESNIDQTLRSIASACWSMEHLQAALGDLATYILSAWKKKRSLVPKLHSEVRINATKLKNEGLCHVYIPSRCTDPNFKYRCTQSKRYAKLLQRDAVEEETGDVGFTLPKYNSLGSKDARRVSRPIVLLDSLAAKINRDHTESMKKNRSKGNEVEGEEMGRVNFRVPQLMYFKQEEPVEMLLMTLREQRKRKRDDLERKDDVFTLKKSCSQGNSVKLCRSSVSEARVPQKSILKANSSDSTF